jgi:CheY-like chemotaxis protein
MKTIDRNDALENEKKYNVLIVEDDQTTRDLLIIFVSENYYATEASTGEDAIEFAKGRKYDAVLMDISLNGINGLDAAKIIRLLPGYENTPIIAVTAFAMRGDKEKFLQGGCTDYLSKPFAKKTIIELLQKAINESLVKQSKPEIIYN